MAKCFGPLGGLLVLAAALAPGACQTPGSAGPLGYSTLSASPSERSADGNSIITLAVALQDGYGRILPGVSVSFAVAPDGPQLGDSTALTDADGLASTSLTSDVSGNFVVTATALFDGSSLALPASVQVRFVDASLGSGATEITGSGSGSTSSVLISGSTTAGQGPITIGVNLRDSQGIPLIGVPVMLHSSVASDIIAPAQAPTTSYGLATLSLSATAAGRRTLTVTGGGLSVQHALSIVATEANQLLSQLMLAPDTQLLANGNVVSTLQLQVEDDFGNAVYAQPFTLSCTPNCFVQPASVTTSALGLASAGVGATSGGSVTLTAMNANGMQLTLTQMFLQPLTNSLTLSANSLAAAPNGQLVCQLQAADAQGFALPGASFVLSSPSPDVRFEPTRGVVDGNGLASSTLTTSLSGNHIVLARLGGNQQVAASYSGMAQPSICPNQAFMLPLAPSLTLGPNRVPYGVVAADLNGDGFADLAITDTAEAPRLWILLGDGSDGFLSAQSIALTGVAHGLAAGALRSGGLIDLVVTDGNNSQLALYFNQGGGNFALGGTLATPAPPEAVVTADFDQDGLIDIAATTGGFGGGGNAVAVWFNAGNASFGNSLLLPVDAAPTALDVGLLNNDLLPDLAFVSSQNTTFGILMGQPNQSFAPVQQYNLPGVGVGIATGDLDGDGRDDVVVSSAGVPSMHVYLSDPNGAPVAEGNATTDDTMPGAVRIYDVDGDGNRDVLVASSGLRVWLNRGSGTLAAASHLGGLDTAQTLAVFAGVNQNTVHAIAPSALGHELFFYQHLEQGSVAHLATATGAYARALGLVDVTGDAIPDLVVPDFATGALQILQGNANQSFVPLQTLSVAANIVALGTGDVDGDGLVDIVTLNTLVPSLDVVRGAGQGNFVTAVHTAVPLGTTAMALADLDGDGLTDVASVQEFGGQLALWRATGGGNLALWGNIPTAAQASLVAAGDLLGNGLPDLVVVGGGSDFNVYVHLNQAGAGLQPPIIIPVGAAAQAIALGDLDGDGMLDLVVVQHQALRWWRNIGAGAFAAGGNVAINYQSPNQVALLLTDVTGDGTPDVVWVSSGVLGVLTNQGLGQLRVHPDSFVLGGVHQSIVAGSMVQNGVLVPFCASDGAAVALPLGFAGCPG